MAAMAFEAVAKANRAELNLKRTPWSKTGFVNVIKVGKKYQARLQVPGDGRGGSTKRKQHSLPTLFDTVARQHAPGASPLSGGSSHMTGWWIVRRSSVDRARRSRSESDAGLAVGSGRWRARARSQGGR